MNTTNLSMILFSLLCSLGDPASSSLTELVSDPFLEFGELGFFDVVVVVDVTAG